VAGVKRGRGRGQFGCTREKGKRPMHSLVPKFPLPLPLSMPAMQATQTHAKGTDKCDLLKPVG